MRRTISLALAALAITAPAAEAADWEDQLAVAIATRVWSPPCPDGIQVRWGYPVEVDLDWMGIAEAYRCQVWLNPEVPELRAFGPRCTVILHEVGHVSGFGHSDNPRSVMRPMIGFGSMRYRRGGRWHTYYDGVDHRCRNGGEWITR